MEELVPESEIIERTFIMIKPDGVQRGLIGKIIQRFEEKGLKLQNIKMLLSPENSMMQHYKHLQSRDFFNNYIKYMTSGPVVMMVWEGINAIKIGRIFIGPTFPEEASPKMIRGNFSMYVRRGVIHASDSIEAANEEIKLWFKNC
ncbi:nucleoside diphosphate kinase B-like [Leptopilina heterotoma]|uniref:nucleoside diphosphate kinase B-like n=1 Tax=Leptopilina heterotoma TaxID=63436 RepID=UPI001CA8A558|nr:nucleoside diphosphate kinase B-like [Leptopilina heterotoma]